MSGHVSRGPQEFPNRRQTGDQMTRTTWIIPVLAIAAALQAPAARGQAVVLEYDLMVPTQDQTLDDPPLGLDANREWGITAAFQSRNFRDDDARTRWGVLVRYARMRVRPHDEDGFYTDYGSTIIQGSFDHLVARWSRADLALGVALGPSFITDHHEYYGDSCDTAFCDMPEMSWVLSPGAQLTVPVTSQISLLLRARGTIYLAHGTDTYPYLSGFVVSAGIELGSGGSP